MDLIWDLYLTQQLNSSSSTANQANQKANDQQYRVRQLEQSIDRLLLINMAMWELMKSRTGLMESDLLRKMQEIDLRDGVADGRVTPQAAQCPKCGRVNSSRHKHCIYCGQPLAGGPFAAVR
jgi:ribosomal protein S27AE